MTFYSPDHPATFTPGELWGSGLSSLEEAKQRGFIGICDTTDFRLASCEAWMAANTDGAEQLSISARRYFHGKAGPAAGGGNWNVPPPRPTGGGG